MRSNGKLNRAFVPVASTFPEDAAPARVVTDPPEIIRIELFMESATNTVPLDATTRPVGFQNDADRFEPFVNPEIPVPANVVTNPLRSIFLILLFPESATNTLPERSTATPMGNANEARIEIPSSSPGALPANVETFNGGGGIGFSMIVSNCLQLLPTGLAPQLQNSRGLKKGTAFFMDVGIGVSHTGIF